MKNIIPSSCLGLAVLALVSCTTTTGSLGNVEPKAAQILGAMSSKLAAAKTVRVTATREASPGFFVGNKVAEHARINGVVQRPDKLASTAKTDLGTREIRYDGKQLLLVDRAAKTHVIVPAKPTIDETISSIEEVYGFMPPLAELAVNNPQALLMDGVISGKWVGNEPVGKTPCDHLAFKQENLDWEIWVGEKDQLPHQIRVTYPNGEGGAAMVMTAVIQKAELDGPVSASEFAVKVPAGSRALEMIPLN